MKSPTVVCWSSAKYQWWSLGLAEDAARLGYDFHRYDADGDYSSPVVASLNHPRFALQAVQDYGRVLFCDVECRLLGPIPDWPAPTIAIRSPVVPFYLYYNSGTMLLDRSCEPWLETWKRMVERFDFANLDHDRYFVRQPGDLCDELALFGALSAHDVHPHEIQLECLDRDKPAEVARGYWANPTTVLQHPTLQHWPSADTALAKKLFWQNYPGDRQDITSFMAMGSGVTERHAWTFNATSGQYGPDLFDIAMRRWDPDVPPLTSEEL